MTPSSITTLGLAAVLAATALAPTRAETIDPGFLDRMADERNAAKIPGKPLVFSLIAGGHYLRHLRRLRGRIEATTKQALGDLDRIGLRVPQPRDGGFYLWAKLPAGTDEAELCRQAAAHSIFLAPGAVFSPERALHPPAIRINVAHASNPRFLAFMEQALGR